MYSQEEIAVITENKPAGVSRILVSKGGERVYEERPIIAYELTVVFQGIGVDKIYLRIDEYTRFLETLSEVDSKDTNETCENLGPLPQVIFDSAPEWAKYAAMDENGLIFLYNEEPRLYEHYSAWEGGKNTRQCLCWSHVPWKESLTKKAK